MNSSSKFLGLTLALLIGVGGITGCQAPVTQTKPVVNTPSGSQVANNTSKASPSASPAASSKESAQKASTDMKDALIMDSEDEKYLDDSDTTLSSGGKSFATKALNLPVKTEVQANAGLGAREDIRATVAANAAVKAPALKKKVKQFVSKNGAVTRSEDGTIKVDVAKLKENLKQAKEVLKEEVQKLKRKNNVVRKGDIEEVKNDDGSTTKTGSVAFENQKNGAKRNILTVKNVDSNGKLEDSTYELTAEHPNFTRTVKRTVTVNADGSKDIVFYSLTTFKAGGKREVNRNTHLGADGNGTATGTIKVTAKDGTEKTYTTTTTISKSNGTITIAKDPATGAEVKTEEKPDGTTTASTTVDGKLTTEAVTEDTATKTEDSTGTTPAPEASASPVASTEPVATATPATVESPAPVASTTPAA